MLAVNLIHRGEVIHVLQEDSATDGFGHGTSRGCENLPEIAEDEIGLCFDVAFDDLLGGRINRDLSGDEDKSIGFDGLRVWADRLRSVFGMNDFAHEQFSVVSSV